MSDIVIRQFVPQDRSTILEIFTFHIQRGDSFTYDSRTSREEALSHWVGEDTYTYIAEYQGQIAGVYAIRNNKPYLGSHIANASFMVSPNFQGKSIGRTMGEHAILEAKKLGYRAMQFNIVISTNIPAVELWQKLGFAIIGTVPEAFWHKGLSTYVDAYIMYRKL